MVQGNTNLYEYQHDIPVKINVFSITQAAPFYDRNYTNCVCFGSDLFEYLNFMNDRKRKKKREFNAVLVLNRISSMVMP